ncbi:P-loop containing nucleoside triphosphate hydrolase protein [Amniculicola lignicola CBS 123094]|uniref:P-loop containing nucleoside triphosphate hydrolase protein n=1 Tax=Amniculicola lignicola CBS 123094 TaxID=1392246 RepID=A0A6A5W9Z0_9PLEO|nr:P-loop containing nucleoside triphosphate hydrolase protein [Amniculicola lignicola CBS 123094]
MDNLKGVNDADEMVLLSKQRTTDGPHGVFDASQFKRSIDQDVSADIIEKLQKEFGDNLAGAIDKFLEKKEASSKKSISQTNNKDNEETYKDTSADPLGRKEFVTRDRYWDKFKRQYVLQKPSKKRDESKKHKNCVIFVRRDYSEDMTSFNTVLIISGLVLRNALRHIFRGAEGFSLTENPSTELAPKFLFWARPELEMLAEHYESIKDKKAIFEIKAGLKFIDSEFEEMISVLPSLIPHSITFEYLWALLPADCLVVGKNSLGLDTIWSIRSHSVQKMEDGIFLVMNAEYIVWDGSKIGNVRHMLRIGLFSGVRPIEELPYIPLKFHPRREEVMQIVRERSAKTIKFWQPKFKHKEHHGTGLAEMYDKVEHYPFSGRVLIDPKMMRQMQPANKIMPKTWEISDLRKSSRTCFSDLITEEDKPQILETLLSDPSQVISTAVDAPAAPRRIIRRFGSLGDMAQNEYSSTTSSDCESTDSSSLSTAIVKTKGSSKQPELSTEQMLLVSSLLYGYSLREGKWGAFSVDNVSPITWNDTIFDSLVIDKTLKETIYRLVVAHSRGSSQFDDFVKGKGKGLIGLFFGPPGSGKTLTAEAIAETAKMPLYAVSSGALGHEATEIHSRLADILKLASHWKAVLLLDEADVFLAQRTLTDIVRNAIVSVFLRELEYYQGILLLTTNQADVIDEAFQSRIHISLQYPSLDAVARLKIWENFMVNARQSKGVTMDIDHDSLRALAQMPLNGRQIKNTISMAMKIATMSESRAITADSLRDTVRLLQTSNFSDPKILK